MSLMCIHSFLQISLILEIFKIILEYYRDMSYINLIMYINNFIVFKRLCSRSSGYHNNRNCPFISSQSIEP